MPAEAQNGSRRKVVIVGGGFGGLTAARELKGTDVDVTLVDPRSHHLFQPLLYQLACGGLSTGECASPIRAAVKHSSNTTVLMATATGLDVERRQITLDRGETLDYDSLIVACGAETSYFGKDEWRDVSCSLKTLADAVDLRNRVYGAYEEAERAEDPAEREQWLTFVVIGGGPTGVELAGQMAIIARHTMKGYFERIQPAKARVILLDAGDRVTAAFSEKLSAKVAKYLAELGVTVRQGARVTEIDAQGVTFQIDGAEERIDARTVVWAAGVQAVGFARTLAEATGARDRPRGARADRGGSDGAGPSRDLRNRRRNAGPWPRRPTAAGPGHSIDPASAPRGQGDPGRRGRREHAIQIPGQGCAGRRRPGQSGVRNPRPQALRAAGVLHLPDGAHVLPLGWRPRASCEGPDRLDQRTCGRSPEPGDRRGSRDR